MCENQFSKLYFIWPILDSNLKNLIHIEYVIIFAEVSDYELMSAEIDFTM